MKLSHQTIIEGRRVIKGMKIRILLIIMAVCLSMLLVGSPALAYVTKQIDKMSPKLSGRRRWVPMPQPPPDSSSSRLTRMPLLCITSLS